MASKSESKGSHSEKNVEERLLEMSQNLSGWALVMGYAGPLFFFFLGVALFIYHPRTSPTAVIMYASFIAFEVTLTLLLPGKVEKSIPLIDGTPTKYKINGFLVFVISIVTFLAGAFSGLWKGSIIYDNLWDLIILINTSSFLFSLGLYLKGKFFPERKILSTGSFILDFWYGLELDPHIGSLDVKFFCEGRPQLVAWILVGLSIAFKQYEIHGKVSTPMILFVLFTTIYAGDYFWFEICMTTTWDIIAERFGWMLVWGTCVFFPFFYNIQGFYLLSVAPDDLPLWLTVLIVIEFLIGYYIFRSSNLQKHNFKFNSNTVIWGKPAEFISTEDGKKKLLVSGWWGLARHPNYFGDILISIGFSLPTLIAPSFIPFIHPIWMIGLLAQRFTRDHTKCQISYGKTWDKYLERVPYTLIPYVI